MAKTDCMPEPRSSPEPPNVLFDAIECVVDFDSLYPYSPALLLGPDVLLRAAFLPCERVKAYVGKGVILIGHHQQLAQWLEGKAGPLN
ncbi:hypothetical protein HNQ50_002398 [Silvimonas terrae]|uniref:Uncharacterized protein n=1 Tax=Silvimonas terrae TaxID=300266 RepID=A0A840RGM1_9NEIS|nr:hypothetical protein [Silvimonas terrae]